jgi:hypothetical protein
MDHIQAHSYVELIETKTEKVERANNVAKAITAAQAFRRYEWLQRVPGKLVWNLGAPSKNAAGDFRGMVLSARWKSAFNVTVKAGEVLEKIGTFASIAAAITNSYGEIDKIVRSQESWDRKSAKLGAQLTGMAMHVLTGVVTPTAHLLLTSMPIQGYCDMVDLARGVSLGNCRETLKGVDSVIAVSAEEVSDGDEIYSWINTEINPRVSKVLGF